MAAAAKKTKPTLEDYIFDMESRPPDSNKSADADLWTQLQQKEADLLLAAELGKALLEKNEELVKQQEKIIEEYSAKLEVSRIYSWAEYYVFRNRNSNWFQWNLYLKLAIGLEVEIRKSN